MFGIDAPVARGAEMRVNDLQGEALDLWAAKAEGYALSESHEEIGQAVLGTGPAVLYWAEVGNLGLACKGGGGYWRPSTDWAQGGPIIERERLTLEAGDRYGDGSTYKAWVRNAGGFFHAYGATLLVAAMRAYVASKFGEEVPDSAD
jgi:Protein of unknown function (DUF2591)